MTIINHSESIIHFKTFLKFIMLIQNYFSFPLNTTFTNIKYFSRWLIQNDEDTIYLDVESPVLRYLTHMEIRSRFPKVLTTDSLGNSKKVIC